MGTLSVAINSVPVQILESSFQESDAISAVSTLMFKVKDDSGANHYTKGQPVRDRKSTRLNSSHQIISYAVFCLKKKNSHYQPYCPAVPILDARRPYLHIPRTAAQT